MFPILFLRLTLQRQGLIDFAFDPNFGGGGGAFYLSYTVLLSDGVSGCRRCTQTTAGLPLLL